MGAWIGAMSWMTLTLGVPCDRVRANVFVFW
jgi:hypothetical protein